MSWDLYTLLQVKEMQRNRTQTFLGPMGVTNLWDKSASNKHNSN